MADGLHLPTRIRASISFLAAALFAAAIAHGDPKRAVPNYDGRGNPDVDADSWVLWIPRVALSPLYLANELVRRPLGAFVKHGERHHWANSVDSLFTSGEGGKSVVVPIVLYDYGLLPSVGVSYAREDLLAGGNTLRLHGATWGPRSINLAAADRYALTRADSVQARFEWQRAEDNLYFGIGPDVTSSTRARYGLQRLEGAMSYQRRLTEQSRVDLASGIHRISFVEGTCCDDPSMDARIAAGDLITPPGYRDPYTTAFVGGVLRFDSRIPRPAPASGVYVRVHGNSSFDLHQARSWIEYGGVLGAAVDLTGHQRTLEMQLALDFVDPLRGTPLPFTEYAQLTSELMPGFVTGWMTGRSFAAAQLGYTWPVWLWLDGQARFTIGNAFGEHLDGLAPRKVRLSGDLGFTTNTARDHGFEVLFGLGTETLEQGANITSVRVTFGSRRGF